MTYPFVQATHYTKGRGGNKPRLIVVHTMETPESEGRAKQVAAWFAGTTAPQASAHYMCDDKDVIQSVQEADTAWAVDDFALNEQSISIEHAGSAAQSAAQWADGYSLAELKISAALAADIAKRNNIPAVKLTPADVLAGKSGFVGHNDITIAKKISGGHSDPGANFPWTQYLNLIKETV
jgi:N-acetyl-anhydromuramyl-L-alanine amidase AmpD